MSEFGTVALDEQPLIQRDLLPDTAFLDMEGNVKAKGNFVHYLQETVGTAESVPVTLCPSDKEYVVNRTRTLYYREIYPLSPGLTCVFGYEPLSDEGGLTLTPWIVYVENRRSERKEFVGRCGSRDDFVKEMRVAMEDWVEPHITEWGDLAGLERLDFARDVKARVEEIKSDSPWGSFLRGGTVATGVTTTGKITTTTAPSIKTTTPIYTTSAAPYTSYTYGTGTSSSFTTTSTAEPEPEPPPLTRTPGGGWHMDTEARTFIYDESIRGERTGVTLDELYSFAKTSWASEQEEKFLKALTGDS